MGLIVYSPLYTCASSNFLSFCGDGVRVLFKSTVVVVAGIIAEKGSSGGVTSISVENFRPDVTNWNGYSSSC